MTKDSTACATKAAAILADCETLLDEAIRYVRVLPSDLKQALEDHTSAQNFADSATEKYFRILNSSFSQERLDAAKRKSSKAHGAAYRANRYLEDDIFDAEYRKSVARQIAGLLRQDSIKELDLIASRTSDSESIKTVSQYKTDVERASRYLIKMFVPEDHEKGSESPWWRKVFGL